jgi:cytochrome P450
MAAPPPSVGDIATPLSSPGLLARLLTGQRVPAAAARLGARLAASRGRPWRFGTTVIAARHADVRELLSRDLDFVIAPVNAGRIDEVNGPFVLGMDRCGRLETERRALYRALAAIDYAPLREAIATEAASRLSGAATIDIVADYARPIAAHSAQRLFGIAGTDEATFEDMARAIFAHTFLNLGNDETVRQRAIRAAGLMRQWLGDEIARRGANDPTNDMMGALLRDGALDADGVRRTLGGMLVGSVDTTASTVAKIVATLGEDAALRQQVAADADHPERMRGWCWDVLRRWPHNPILLRQAAAATTLAGTEVKAGDRVVAWTQAAMQDSSIFADPDRIRPDREPSGYLHLGAGLHPCAGRAVNAFQIPLLVAAVLRRGIRSVGRIGWAGPFPARLPVTLE